MPKFEISVHIWFHISSLKFRFVFLNVRTLSIFIYLHLHLCVCMCLCMTDCADDILWKKFKILSPLSWGAENVPFNKFNDWMNIWMKMIKLYTHACTHVQTNISTILTDDKKPSSRENSSKPLSVNRFIRNVWN